MKKTFGIVVVLLFVAAVFVASATEDMKKGGEMMKGEGMMKEGMMGKGMQGGGMGMCPMHGMMGGMMQKTVVPTSDGGVIIMLGNKLMKYDKDLNLVKEVEVKIDYEAMQKNMMKMCENCPMCKMMMKEMKVEKEKPEKEDKPD